MLWKFLELGCSYPCLHGSSPSANEKDPKLPDLESSGWRIGSDGVEIVWTEAAIVPQQLIDILCEKETSDSSVEDDIEDDVEMENFIDEVYDDESDNDEV